MNSISTVMKRATVGALILAAIAPSMASAASPQELRRDRQEIREETRDLRAAKAYGDRRDVRDAREDLREARQEYREDRREYRDDRRSAYRHPAFRADFRYRSFAPGMAITRSYYGPRYTVTNYRALRLAPPARHQVYVRHYGDLLLVNTRNGRVVKVIRGYYR